MKKLFFCLALFCSVILFSQEQPFEWSWKWDKDTFTVTLNAPSGSYVYRNMTEIKLQRKEKLLKASVVPEAVQKNDPVMGKTEIYEGRKSWRYPVAEKDLPFTLTVSWQGCGQGEKSSEPVCFLPQTVTKKFDSVQAAGILYGNKTEVKQAKAISGFTIERTGYGYMNADKFISFLKGEHTGLSFAGKGIFLVILLSILGGILLNLTPCVLPMIPINLAIIGADTENKKLALIRALVYAAGIAIAYGVVGLAVVLGGATFGALDSYWYFNLGVAVVFILLGLSMFDIFSIDFSRYSSNLKTPSTARLAGVFLLGAISALLAGACVAPVVIAVLIHSAGLYASGNLFGLFLPFALGIGMGLPWPLIAVGLAHTPKPGMWMVKVKHIFGVIIVLVGLYYAYLGVSLLLAGRSASGGETELHSAASIAQTFKEAKKDGRPVLIDFWAEWCKNCKAMDMSTMKNAEVREALKAFHVIKFDATNVSSPEVKAEMERFGVTGLPTFVIVKPE